MHNRSIPGTNLERLFQKYIEPCLKGTDLKLVKGASSGKYSYDYIIRNTDRITHIINLKQNTQRPPREYLDKLRGYKVYSLMDGNKLPVKVIVACFNDGLWNFYEQDGTRVDTEVLFGKLKSATKARGSDCKLRIVSWVISGILMLLALVDYAVSILCSCNNHSLTESLVRLLCAAGLFAILPFILPRIKEFRLGNFVCLVFETNIE